MNSYMSINRKTWEESDRFLDKTQENCVTKTQKPLNRAITEMDSVKAQPAKETQGWTASLLHSTKLLKNYFQCLNYSNNEKEGILPNSFYDVSITLIGN